MRENQLFHEIYGSYYSVIAKILAEAVRGDLTRTGMMEIVREHAFSESTLSIPDMLRSGRWPLLDAEMGTEIVYPPQMPLTTLQKRWLKAILADPRIRLFAQAVEMEELEGVRPLFEPDTVVCFDRFADGDPFEDPVYVSIFRRILEAIHEKKALQIRYQNRRNRDMSVLCFPHHLEYSPRDDKFRLHARSLEQRRQYAVFQINLSRIDTCEFAQTDAALGLPDPVRRTAILELDDVDNAMERAMLHFSYLEKETEKTRESGSEPDRYRITLHYDKEDETELLIRILSFGPDIRVLEPESLRTEIRRRILRQLDQMRKKEQ